MDELTQKLQKSIQRFKGSAELLNLTKILENLVRQKNFAEAHKVQVKIQSLEKTEQEKFNMEIQNKIQSRQIQLAKRHESESMAFAKKVESGMEELKKKRAMTEEQMLKKFQNNKIDLEKRQQLEKLSFTHSIPSKAVASPAKKSIKL